jgi:hypothetical protein
MYAMVQSHEALDLIEGTIHRAVVDQDEFEIIVRLIQYRLDRPGQMAARKPAIGGHHDREPGRFPQFLRVGHPFRELDDIFDLHDYAFLCRYQ